MNFSLFSPDSEHFAYGAVKDRKGYMVLDGQEGKKYDGISSFLFSSDSKNYVYIATERNGKQYIVLNDKEGNNYDRVYFVRFSSDSEYIGYGVKKGNEIWWIADKVEDYVNWK